MNVSSITFPGATETTTVPYTNETCLEGIKWAFSIFGVCIVTAQDYWSFIMGIVSLVVWFLPLLPQMYKNYVRGTCDEALSIYFIIFWFFGDTMNLAGSVISGQLPTQVFIAIAYLFQDCLALFQYAYYSKKKRSNERWKGDLQVASRRKFPRSVLCCFICFSMVSSTINSALAFDVVQRQHSRSGDQVFVSHTMFSETAQVIGYAMGCLSALFYLLGRVMQLNDNIKQKSTQGVSIVTFWLIIVANATYGISVCLGGSGVDYYVLHLPWLVGSFGCIFMDAVVMFQYYFVYSTRFSSKVQPRSDGTSCCKNAF